MDVTELTADELRKLADEKAGGANVRTLDIDGLTVHIDTDKAKSWKAFRIMSKLTGELGPESLGALVEFVELVSDVDEAAIVEHCGGDDATLEGVVGIISQIVTEAAPKNS